MAWNETMLVRAQAALDREGIRIIRLRLEKIGVVAERWFREHPDAVAVSIPELAAWPAAELDLRTIQGESYDTIVVSRGWGELAVTLTDGRTVRFGVPENWPGRH
jgi:hypothetical protein